MNTNKHTLNIYLQGLKDASAEWVNQHPEQVEKMQDSFLKIGLKGKLNIFNYGMCLIKGYDNPREWVIPDAYYNGTRNVNTRFIDTSLLATSGRNNYKHDTYVVKLLFFLYGGYNRLSLWKKLDCGPETEAIQQFIKNALFTNYIQVEICKQITSTLKNKNNTQTKAFREIANYVRTLSNELGASDSQFWAQFDRDNALRFNDHSKKEKKTDYTKSMKTTEEIDAIIQSDFFTNIINCPEEQRMDLYRWVKDYLASDQSGKSIFILYQATLRSEYCRNRSIKLKSFCQAFTVFGIGDPYAKTVKEQQKYRNYGTIKDTVTIKEYEEAMTSTKTKIEKIIRNVPLSD